MMMIFMMIKNIFNRFIDKKIKFENNFKALFILI